MTTLVSIRAAAEILDATERHVGELIEAGELTAVDIAVHRAPPGKTVGADGKSYSRHKRRLRTTAESIAAFLARRTVGRQRPSPRRQRNASNVIQFF